LLRQLDDITREYRVHGRFVHVTIGRDYLRTKQPSESVVDAVYETMRRECGSRQMIKYSENKN